MKTAYQHTKKGQSCFLRAGLLMLLVLFCSVSGWAAKQESIKKKEINKSFNVGKNDILQVDNRYGNITVTHWSKAESEGPFLRTYNCLSGHVLSLSRVPPLRESVAVCTSPASVR